MSLPGDITRVEVEDFIFQEAEFRTYLASSAHFSSPDSVAYIGNR